MQYLIALDPQLNLTAAEFAAAWIQRLRRQAGGDLRDFCGRE